MKMISINIQRLIYLLMTSENHLSIDEIASKLNLSKRTINNYFFFLRNDEEYSKVLNVNKTRNKFIITPKEDYQSDYKQLKYRLQILFSGKEENYGKSSYNRVLDILILLLDNKSYISINDISNNLYYSKSVLDKDFIICKKIIEQYNLKLISKPHYGVIIEGEEIYKRFLLTEIIETKHKEEGITDEFTSYSKYYANDGNERIEVKKTIIDAINKTTNSLISNQTLKRLYKYLIISKKRVNDGLTIKVNQSLIKYIENTEQYNVSKDIIDKLEVGNEIVKQSEIYGLTIYLLSRTQFNEKNRSSLYTEFNHYAKYMTKDLLDCILNDYHIDIKKINTQSENLILDYFTLFNIRNLFNTTRIRALSYYSDNAKDNNCSLSYLLAKNSLIKISKKYHIQIDEYYVLRLSNLFKYFFDHYEYYHKQAKLVISTDYGYLENNEIKKKLLKSDYEGFIESIDILNFYQLSTQEYYEQYDLLLLDYPEAYYLPAFRMSIKNISLTSDYEDFFQDLKNATVNITQILSEVISDGIYIKAIDDITSSNDLMSISIFKNSISELTFNELLFNYGTIYENILILLLPSNMTLHSIFAIFKLNNCSVIKDIDYIVFFSANDMISRSFTKLLDHILISIKQIIDKAETNNNKHLTNEDLSEYLKINNLY